MGRACVGMVGIFSILSCMNRACVGMVGIFSILSCMGKAWWVGRVWVWSVYSVYCHVWVGRGG